MPSVNPCLGCGFQLDADGYLVRKGETNKPFDSSGLWGISPDRGGFKYCDPGTGRSWDVPWNMPWGQIEDTFFTPNLQPSNVLTLVYASTPDPGYYAPYRRTRFAGWMAFTGADNLGMGYIQVINGAVASPESYFGGTIPGAVVNGIVPFMYSISGPNMPPYASLWPANAYVQYGIKVRNINSGGGIIRTLYACVEDVGPASGIYYSALNRFWPTVPPY